MSYEFHPIAGLFPLLEGVELEALADDIKANGLREPAWLYEGKILDGRNRSTACLLAGVKLTTRDFKGNRADALRFVWGENFNRRHLDASQKAAVVILKLRMEEEFKAEVEKIKSEAKERKKRKPADSVRQQIAAQKPDDRKTADILAKASGTNRTYIQAGAKLDTETLEAVRDGKRKMPDVVREQKRETIKAHLEAVDTQEAKAIQGVYDVVIIDPPWPMKKIERDCRPNQSEFEYPTMTLKDIQKLCLPVADDCHVWLWTTQRFLPDAVFTLAGWGLTYVCTFVWHKPGGFQPVGLPQYNCEFVLYARKGSPVFLDTKSLSTCFEAPRGKHSEKPREFYDMVRRVTAGRRLDMFNRHLMNNGGTCPGIVKPNSDGSSMFRAFLWDELPSDFRIASSNLPDCRHPSFSEQPACVSDPADAGPAPWDHPLFRGLP